jgi:hypothetical protein
MYGVLGMEVGRDVGENKRQLIYFVLAGWGGALGVFPRATMSSLGSSIIIGSASVVRLS